MATQRYRPRGMSKQELVAYLLAQAELSDDGKDCLNSDYAQTDWGYPTIKYDGKMRKIGQLVLEVYRGPSNRLYMLHSCHNPGCINPNHLRWGTNKENMIDMVKAGRQRHQKLKTNDIDLIFEYRKQGMTQRNIAQLFDISDSHICRIINGKCWSYSSVFGG